MRLTQTVVDWPLRRARLDADEAYAAIARIGFDGVEMVPRDRWSAAQRAGLVVHSVAGPRTPEGLSHRTDHETVLPQLRGAIAVARAAEIPYVVVFSGDRRGESNAAGIDACAAGLDRLAPEATEAAVTLLLEILNTGDHPDYHAASSEFVFNVVRRVDSLAVRALYDAYHAARMGEPVIDDVGAHARLIGHMHVAGAPRRDFPGANQEVDYRRLVSTALSAGYRGGWGHEYLPRGDVLPELIASRALLQRYANESE